MSYSQWKGFPSPFNKGYFLDTAWVLFYFTHSSNMCDHLALHPKEQHIKRKKELYKGFTQGYWEVESSWKLSLRIIHIIFKCSNLIGNFVARQIVGIILKCLTSSQSIINNM